MATPEYQQRFAGIARLYGSAESHILQQAHVCVIGIGGVGSWAVEALARSGIGQITLIDMDEVCVSNVNRQIHALAGPLVNTVGQSKVAVMAERVQQINPDCQLHPVDDFITPENVAQLLDKPFDYVLDAIDSLPAKAALLAHCKRNKLKLITIGGAGGQKDPTQIKVADLARTLQDPLAKKLKERLRRDYGFSKNPKRKFAIDCVFSTEQLIYPQADGKTGHSKRRAQGAKKMDCANGFGATTVVTATFAFVAVARIIDKLIARYPTPPAAMFSDTVSKFSDTVLEEPSPDDSAPTADK